MAQVNIRMDDDLKARADVLFEQMGLNMTTAVNVFVRQVVRQRAFPFEITADEDPFYSESNMRMLRQSIADLEAGRGIVTKTMEELEAMAHG